MALKRAVVFSMGSSIFVGLFNIFAQVFYARQLGIDAISDYAVVFVLTQIAVFLCSFGVNQSAISLGGDTATINAAWSFQIRLSVTVCAASSIALIGVFLLGFSSIYDLMIFAYISLMGFLASLLGHIFNITKETNLSYGYVSVIRAGAYLLANAFGILCAMFFDSALPMVLRDLFNGVLFTIFAFIGSGRFGRQLIRVHTFGPARPTSPELMRVTLRNWATNLGSAGVLRLDYWLAAFVLGKSGLGIYFQMRSLIDGSLAILLNTVQSVIFSHMARAGETVRWEQWMPLLYVLSLFLAGGVSLAATFLARPVISVILGDQWIVGAPILVGLSAYAVFRGLFELMIALAKVAGRQHAVLFGQATWALGLVISMPILTQRFDLLGNGLASAFGALVGITSALLIAKRALATPGK